MSGIFRDTYPYTDFHELNLDWILKQVRQNEEMIKNWIQHSTIKYANPINWNISTQYEANTIVIDENTGDAYISKIAVPSGIPITNNEYWIKVFNYVKDRRSIHVRDFGAVGDGVTDDTDAIQNALNYVADNLLKTVIIDTGRYHTTRPLILPNNIYVTADTYGSAFFLDNFDRGCFTLPEHGAWLENLGFLTSESGVAIYGSGCSSINLYRLQCSGQTVGSDKIGSQFLKLEGEWNVIMIDDCLIDAGGPVKFAIELRGKDNSHITDRDIYIRNSYIDNFAPKDNQGGTIYADSIPFLRMQGCIVRSSSNSIVTANNYVNGKSYTYFANGILSRSTKTGYALSIGNNCHFVNENSYIGKDSYISNNGVYTTYSSEKGIDKPIINKNVWTPEHNVSIIENGNGTYAIRKITEDGYLNTGVVKAFNTNADTIRTGITYLGRVGPTTRWGIGFQIGTNRHLLLVQQNAQGSTLVASLWSNYGNTYTSDIIAPFQLVNGKPIELMLRFTPNGAGYIAHYLYSYDGVYWAEFGTETINQLPDNTVLTLNNETAGETVVNNILYYTEE